MCAVFHANMLTKMESKEYDVRVGQGVTLLGDGVWLHGNDRPFQLNDNKLMSIVFGRWRSRLSDHVYYCAKSSKSSRQSSLILN